MSTIPPTPTNLPDDLTPAEKQLWENTLAGRVCDLNPTFPNEADRHIRSETFQQLCRRPDIPPSGITLFNAIFPEDLDLSNHDFSFGLDLDKCTFLKSVDFHGSSLRYLYLEGSTVTRSLGASRTSLAQDVFLRNGFVAKGQVGFANAKVGGTFDCSDGKFENEGEECLRADGIDVNQNVFLRNGFVAKGQVAFNDAKVGGGFECDGAKFECEGENCLRADGIDVRQGVYLRNGFVAKGQVGFANARIVGAFDCSNGKFENEGESCLWAEGIDVTQGVYLRNGFVAKGQVNFSGAEVRGSFDCSDGKFENEGEVCLRAQDINVNQNVFLCNGFVAKGQVDFSTAKVGGQFDCWRSEFLGSTEALSLWKAHISHDVFLSSGSQPFHAVGALILSEATIGGNLICGQEKPSRKLDEESPSAGALDSGIALDGVKIGGGLYFAPQTCGGPINLSGATIGKICDHYAMIDSMPRSPLAGWWHDLSQNAKDRLNALNTKWGKHKDTNGDARQRQYKLYDLRYHALEPGMCKDWRELVEWIRNADGGEYHPQPYERLAAVLQAQGHESEATNVRIAQRTHHLSALSLPRRLLEIFLYDLPIRFGYKPWQAAMISLALLIAGGVAFDRGYHSQLFVPSDGDVLTKTVDNRDTWISQQLHREIPKPTGKEDWAALKQAKVTKTRLIAEENGRWLFVPEGYPQFNAAIYTLDTFLPIVDLQQNSYWLPDRSKPGGLWLWRVYWGLDILGWFLTTLLVASLTGLVRGKETETLDH